MPTISKNRIAEEYSIHDVQFLALKGAGDTGLNEISHTNQENIKRSDDIKILILHFPTYYT